MDFDPVIVSRSCARFAPKSGIDNQRIAVYLRHRRRSKGLAQIKFSQSEVDWVISLAGQPAGPPNLKKPTALRGVVGVWNCESSDYIRAVMVHVSTLLASSQGANG